MKFIIGKKIKGDVPDVFGDNFETFKLSIFKSFINFWPWITKKLTKNFGK